MSCFASTFLLIAALLAGTAISLTYHYGTENLSDKLEASSTELAEAESDKTEALSKVDSIDEQVESKLQPYKDENTKLSKRIDELAARNDELVARNDDLRDRLDETFYRNAILLQRFAEQATIDEVASVEPMDTPDT